MIRFLLISSSLLYCVVIYGQLDTVKDNYYKKHIEIHGFIKSDAWFDSRQVLVSREGLFALFPLDVQYDQNGKDINAQSSFNFSAISTRIGLKFKNFSAFGATASALIEADFTGASNATINTLRLRHAYLKLHWERHELLMGQYWHPMFVIEAFPLVLSLNTGSPFQPFIRNPQFSYTYFVSKRIQLLLSAISQRDNATGGIVGNSYSYLSNSTIPNLHAQFKFQGNNTIWGIGFDAKWIKPRLVTDSNIIANEILFSNSVMLYLNYRKSNFEFRTKAIYGQNLSEHLLLGGYAVSTKNPLNDDRTYTSTQHLFYWFFASYQIQTKNLTWKPNLFLGYVKNLGTIKDNIQQYYGLGNNIDQLYRLALGTSISSGPVQFAFEWENTIARYGTYDNTERLIPTNLVSNHRFSVASIFQF